MKKIAAVVFFICIYTGLLANLTSININKATGGRYIEEIAYLVDVEKMVDHWTPEWNYTTPKERISEDLKKIYEKIEDLGGKTNKEKELLQGIVGFYLYNLDSAEYGKKCEEIFNKVIEMDREDYRGYWFYAKYLIMSLNTDEGIKMLHEAAGKREYSEYPALFWEDYASLSYLAGMLGNTLMGMRYSKEVLGREGYFEENLGDVVRGKLKSYDPLKKIKAKELWELHDNMWRSWQLGIKIEIEPGIKVSPGDYEDKNGIFIIKPPAEKINSKEKGEYSVTIACIVPKEGETVDSIIKNAFSKYKDIKKLEEESTTESAVYEIIEKEKKKENHFIITAKERNEPKFPGVAIEVPEGMDKTGTFTYSGRGERFKGKIIYLFILSANEKIYDKAKKAYEDLLENKITVE